MNIHWFQHVPFEGLGSIESWAERNDHKLIPTRFWAGDPLPNPQEIQMLIVMGGPMGVHDEHLYPWLLIEKSLISEVVLRDGVVLGICLGAQLLAATMGAKVYHNEVKEIGWYPLTPEAGQDHPLLSLFPRDLKVFHWHGDTFDIPKDGGWLQSSEGCKNQSFLVGDRLLGLQYHLEMSGEGVRNIIDNCGDELVSGDWIQSEPQLLDGRSSIHRCNQVMDGIMDYLVSKVLL